MLRNKSVAKINYGQPVKPGDYHKLKEISHSILRKEHDSPANSHTPPDQDLIVKYMLSPAEGSLNYEQSIDEMLLRI